MKQEDYMKEGLFESYSQSFDQNLKLSMEGLIDESNAELSKAFRELIEKIIPKMDFYFSGNYPVLEPGKSDRLIKMSFYEKVEISTELGDLQNFWLLKFDRNQAKDLRD